MELRETSYRIAIRERNQEELILMIQSATPWREGSEDIKHTLQNVTHKQQGFVKYKWHMHCLVQATHKKLTKDASCFACIMLPTNMAATKWCGYSEDSLAFSKFQWSRKRLSSWDGKVNKANDSSKGQELPAGWTWDNKIQAYNIQVHNKHGWSQDPLIWSKVCPRLFKLVQLHRFRLSNL